MEVLKKGHDTKGNEDERVNQKEKKEERDSQVGAVTDKRRERDSDKRRDQIEVTCR